MPRSLGRGIGEVGGGLGARAGSGRENLAAFDVQECQSEAAQAKSESEPMPANANVSISNFYDRFAVAPVNVPFITSQPTLTKEKHFSIQILLENKT